MRQVIVNADRETVLRLVGFEVFKYAENLIRRRIFAAETVTSADNDRTQSGTVISGFDVKIQRIAEGARLFRAVKNGDFFDRFRQIFEEILRRERTIEMNGQKTGLFAVCVEVIDNFLRRLANGTHRDNDAFRIRSTVIIERMILTARDFAEIGHRFVNKFRQSFIVRVDGFACLEINIRILSRTAKNRMIRRQCAFAERLNGIPVEDFAEIVKADRFDFLDLMRRTETVKEVDERNAAFDGNEMCNSRKVHDFLNACLGEHRAPRLTCRENILMVTENVQR